MRQHRSTSNGGGLGTGRASVGAAVLALLLAGAQSAAAVCTPIQEWLWD